MAAGDRSEPRRPGRTPGTFVCPTRFIAYWLNTRECVLRKCGHRYRVPRLDKRPKRWVACHACGMLEKMTGPGLKTFWFCRIGRMLFRCWKWGDLMYETDIQKTGVSCAGQLIVVRAPSFSHAKKRAMTTWKYHPREERLWQGLTPSRTRRRTARCGSSTTPSAKLALPCAESTSPPGGQ